MFVNQAMESMTKSCFCILLSRFNTSIFYEHADLTQHDWPFIRSVLNSSNPINTPIYSFIREAVHNKNPCHQRTALSIYVSNTRIPEEYCGLNSEYTPEHTVNTILRLLNTIISGWTIY